MYRLYFCILLFIAMPNHAQEVFLLEDVRDVVIYGALEGEKIGWSLEPLGDVNGDGFEDFLTVSKGRNDPPESGYLIYGASAMPKVIDLEDPLPEGVIRCVNSNRVGSVGDFNSDGIHDFAVAVIGQTINEVAEAGETFLIFGGQSLSTIVDLEKPEFQGISIQGHRIREWVGARIRTAGDVNR